MGEKCYLRIGICGCGNHFHGMFEGRYTHIWGQRFHFKEVIIEPGRNEDNGVWRKRCHFFLDVHGFEHRHQTFLERRTPKIGRWNSRAEFIPGLVNSLIHKKPAARRRIVMWIKEFTVGIPKEKRETWLNMEVVHRQ